MNYNTELQLKSSDFTAQNAGIRGIWDGPSSSGDVFCGGTNQSARSLLEELGRLVLQTKDGKDLPDSHQEQIQGLLR